MSKNKKITLKNFKNILLIFDIGNNFFDNKMSLDYIGFDWWQQQT